MIVYRISKLIHARDLSGKGSELSSTCRWNSKGIAVLYTSESRALSTAEVAVHMPLATIPTDYQIISIEIPEDSIMIPDMTDIPKDWDDVPPSILSQKFGDKFVTDNKFLVLKVPSVVVPGDFNYLINPQHKDIGLVIILEVTSYKFDKRLLR